VTHEGATAAAALGAGLGLAAAAAAAEEEEEGLGGMVVVLVRCLMDERASERQGVVPVRSRYNSLFSHAFIYLYLYL